jgi:hypothetical protein
MNSRGFLIVRMLIELAICIAFVIVAVDVDRYPISSHLWLDLPCRLLLAISAVGIFAHVVVLRRDSRA